MKTKWKIPKRKKVLWAQKKRNDMRWNNSFLSSVFFLCSLVSFFLIFPSHIFFHQYQRKPKKKKKKFKENTKENFLSQAHSLCTALCSVYIILYWWWFSPALILSILEVKKRFLPSSCFVFVFFTSYFILFFYEKKIPAPYFLFIFLYKHMKESNRNKIKREKHF